MRENQKGIRVLIVLVRVRFAHLRDLARGGIQT
jgi:hypothetical protein